MVEDGIDPDKFTGDKLKNNRSKTKDKYQPIDMILCDDCIRYRNLIKYIKIGYIQDHNNYPNSLNDVHTLLVNWKKYLQLFLCLVGPFTYRAAFKMYILIILTMMWVPHWLIKHWIEVEKVNFPSEFTLVIKKSTMPVNPPTWNDNPVRQRLYMVYTRANLSMETTFFFTDTISQWTTKTYLEISRFRRSILTYFWTRKRLFPILDP